MNISHVDIVGLFERANVSVPLQGRCLILVGPNGTGKSTIINIIYCIISSQWRKLSQYSFISITLSFSDGSSEKFSREELLSLDETAPSRRNIQPYFDRLEQASLLDDFLSIKQFRKPLSTRISEVLRIPEMELAPFQRYFISNFARVDVVRKFASLQERINQGSREQVLYLPTYRRIERELKIILPDFEERRKRPSSESPDPDVEKTYLEYVGFGMTDVEALLDRKTSEIKDLAREQLTNLSVSLLKELLSTKSLDKSARSNDLTTQSVMRMLDNFKPDALTPAEKVELERSIRLMREGKKQRPGRQELRREFLSSFLFYMSDISRKLHVQESTVIDLAKRLDQYLGPQKKVVYNQSQFSIQIRDAYERIISLSSLSSGEKQIVSIFSLLNLGDHQNYILIVDEPELSLSVVWQQRLLPDILSVSTCHYILAATHSPAIFDNELDSNTIDVRKLYVG